MKDYLPVIERLFYAIAFFIFGWFAKTYTYQSVIPEKEIIYNIDTIFTERIVKEKESVIYNYITLLDSVKSIINDTVIDSINCKQKEVVIAFQDTIINKTFVLVDTLKKSNKLISMNLDSCTSYNHHLFDLKIGLEKQTRKDQRNKVILGGAVVVLTAVLSNIIIK